MVAGRGGLVSTLERAGMFFALGFILGMLVLPYVW